jgi:hypothetical protein
MLDSSTDNVPMPRLSITYNPEIGAKIINVHLAAAGGPICRLEVDNAAHRQVGRSHKHSLKTEQCPAHNLQEDLVDRPELSGRGLREIFRIFCESAKIEHTGKLLVPDEEEG